LTTNLPLLEIDGSNSLRDCLRLQELVVTIELHEMQNLKESW